MTDPWDLIENDDYKSWLKKRQITEAVYNDLKQISALDRSALVAQFEQEQQQQQQQHGGEPLAAVSIEAASAAILDAEGEGMPITYCQVANYFKKHSDEFESILQGFEELAAMDEFKDRPSPFVCIVESSGTGKTQLAATTAFMRPDARVAYFYVGQAKLDNAQEFYKPHIPLWAELRPLLEHFSKRVDSDVEIAGSADMAAFKQGHPIIQSLYTILFPEPGFKGAKTMAALKDEVGNKGPSKFFVYLDEVPPKDGHKNVHAMRLRNFLRAIGIVPILMSTHTGSHNALPEGADPRQDEKIPSLWCRVLAALPRTSTGIKHGYKTPDERPLVAHIVSKLASPQQDSLDECVNAVRSQLLRSKPTAWTKSPIFQLCLLFRSTKNEQDRSLCSHLLVGEHFGHFELERTDIFRSQAKLKGKVRMPEAEREPILFLALASWKLNDLQSRAFPLQNSEGQALSVRAAFELCKDNFTSGVFFANPEALKNDSDLMEVLSLASMTLASLCSDEGYLSGVRLAKFIAMVFAFMLKSDDRNLKNRISSWPGKVESFLSSAVHTPHMTMKIPAVPSAASEFPDVLFVNNSNALRGTLKRPPDEERRDGALDQKNGTSLSTLVHVECKNYKDGVSTEVLQNIIEIMRPNGTVSFLFTSKLNGVWQSGDRHEAFWESFGLNDEGGNLCIMRLQAKGDVLVPSWVSTLCGTSLAPRPGCKYLLVVLEVEEVTLKAR